MIESGDLNVMATLNSKYFVKCSITNDIYDLDHRFPLIKLCVQMTRLCKGGSLQPIGSHHSLLLDGAKARQVTNRMER